MRRIRSKNTEPELTVRRLVWQLGFSGYRIHRKDLPGKPDLAWNRRKVALFVNGCFWHGHDCAEGIRKPKSNREYWIPKIERNGTRDAKNIQSLEAKGWRVIIVWECETKDKATLAETLIRFLSVKTSSHPG